MTVYTPSAGQVNRASEHSPHESSFVISASENLHGSLPAQTRIIGSPVQLPPTPLAQPPQLNVVS
jgi:hypothetical protein